MPQPENIEPLATLFDQTAYSSRSSISLTERKKLKEKFKAKVKQIYQNSPEAQKMKFEKFLAITKRKCINFLLKNSKNKIPPHVN